MGASTFMIRAKGHCAKEAFDNAVTEARYEYGSGGYTGTIAEKDDFIIIKCPKERDPRDYADELMHQRDDERISSKWGPAGCIVMVEGKENTNFPTKVKTDNHIFKGVREWKTFYVGYTKVGIAEKDTERFITMFKDEAFNEAKKIALKENTTVKVKLEKRLVNSQPLVASIEPVSVKSNAIIGEYLFFGWASD